MSATSDAIACRNSHVSLILVPLPCPLASNALARSGARSRPDERWRSKLKCATVNWLPDVVALRPRSRLAKPFQFPKPVGALAAGKPPRMLGGPRLRLPVQPRAGATTRVARVVRHSAANFDAALHPASQEPPCFPPS